jgi:hypothetical protein
VTRLGSAAFQLYLALIILGAFAYAAKPGGSYETF